MNILITQAASELPRALAPVLALSHSVRETDTQDVVSSFEFVRSVLDHSPATNDLVRDMDAIVHSGAVDPEATVSDRLDYQMRCTYNLLRAAVEEGVPRFVYLSSLRLMERYEPGLAVTERWKTLPTTEPSVLCYNLGELVCREFAREGEINVVVLRFGEITAEDDIPGTTALYVDDAANAVDMALTAELSGWLDIFHIQSDVPEARFLTGQPWWSADDVSPSHSLGYVPRRRRSS